MKVPSRLRAACFASCLVGAVFTAPAQAELTSPTDGSVQRGDVLIQDPVGATVSGSSGGLCQATYRIVIRNAAEEVVLDRTVRPPNLLQLGATGPINETWQTTGDVPNGTYRVETTATDRQRTSLFGSCTTSATRTFSATFELRKWEHRFDSAGRNGTVFMNTKASREFQISFSDRQSPIVDASTNSTFEIVSMPKGDAPVLPTDVAACLDDPAACLPETPAECDANPDGCEQRLVLVSATGNATAQHPKWGLQGFFDLKTKAFTAVAYVGTRTEVLGTVGASCGEIRAQIAKAGLDIDSVLGNTPVDIDVPVDGGGPRTVTTNAADLCAFAEALAVELATGPSKQTGILNTPEVAAGLIVHYFLDTRSGAPGTLNAPKYEIHKSAVVPALQPLDLSALPPIAVPELPAVDGVDVPTDLPGLVGFLAPKGQLTQVKGQGWGTGGHIVGALNADTAPNPGDYPVWLPVVSAGLLSDNRIDFVGYPTVEPTNSQTCFEILGTETCVSLGVLVGTGAAVFNHSPLKLPLIP